MQKVSVLMPVYNAHEYIAQSISAVLAQSYADIELLICDDCSTDQSYALLSELKDDRIRLFKNEENLGYLATCNKLAHLATGDLITFQDADDNAPPERVELLVKSLFEQQLDLIGSNVEYIDSAGQVIGRSFYPSTVTERYLVEHPIPFCGASVLFKREVYQKIALYDPAFNRIGAEDHDWLYRAALTFNLGNVEQPLYQYRMHASSFSQSAHEKLSIQLCSEHIAKELYLQRLQGRNIASSKEFIAQRKVFWLQELKNDPSPLLLKQSTVQSLNGQHKKNLAMIWLLIKSNTPIKKKIRGGLLMLIDAILGYRRVFKLKTFYKQLKQN